jgi:hypothetical protein
MEAARSRVRRLTVKRSPSQRAAPLARNGNLPRGRIV